MPNAKAAYLGAMTQHGGAILGDGSSDVLVNGRPLWIATRKHACTLHGPEMVVAGSETVLVNGALSAREGDFLLGQGPPDRIMEGSPDVFIGTPPVGTSAPDGVERFCELYCALKRDWPNLSAQEREDRYEALLAEMFGRFGAPPPIASPELETGGAAAASWDSNDWAINLPQGAWDADQPPNPRHTFHEIRHGEQTFMGMRAHGGGGSQNPHPNAVASAASQPLDPNSAEGRFGRLHGSNELTRSGLDNRNRIIQEIHAANDAEGTGSQRYADAVEAYRQQPGGQDALDAENASGNCNCP